MKFYKFIFLFFIFVVFFMYINVNTLNSISKDNTPPTIKIITPSKSEEYIVSKPTIKARFYDKNGVDLSSIKIYVNGKDVTNKSKIIKNTIKYKPDKKFKRGTQIVKIILSDKFQNKTSLEWYFTVGTPIYKKIHVSKEKFESLDTLKIPVNSSEDEITIYNTKDSSYKDLSKLNMESIYKELFFKDSLICALNPKSNNIKSFNYMKYSYYGDKIFSLIDITNYDTSDKKPFSLKIYDEALNNGWHLSPINTIFTTILSTDLSKDSLYNALKNRRTYVTNSQNLNLDFNINGCQMGSTIKNPSKLNFNISIVDTKIQNTIKNIYIISNNKKIIKNINCSSNLAKSEFTLNEFEKYSYYYLVIIQENNKMTVSAPIWIESD